MEINLIFVVDKADANKLLKGIKKLQSPKFQALFIKELTELGKIASCIAPESSPLPPDWCAAKPSEIDREMLQKSLDRMHGIKTPRAKAAAKRIAGRKH